MDIPTLQSFFMWCTILNAGMMILASLILSIGGDFVYRLHSSFFSISRETFDVASYCWVRFFRIIVIAFCLVPWIALALIA